SPTNGGTTTGEGTYNYNQNVNFSAIANTGYTFMNWTENDNIISTQPNFTIAVNADHQFVANFSLNNYNIFTSANPDIGGTVTGGANYNFGENASLSAIAATGYTFQSWPEGG